MWPRKSIDRLIFVATIKNVKAGLYLRVSTAGQALDGVSLSVQKKHLLTYCELHGHEVVEVLADEGLSGTKATRPGFMRLMEHTRTGRINAVVVYSLSRFARSTKHVLSAAEEFEKRNVSFISLKENLDTSSAMGKFTLTILAGLSQLERDQISERTTDALQHKKAKGQRVGTIPFGFRLAGDGVTLIPDETEARLLELLREHKRKNSKLRVIRDDLQVNGFKNRRGTDFSIQGIHHLLKQVVA